MKHTTRNRTLLFLFIMTLGRLPSVLSAGIEFNRDIRPILAENCFYCHGQDPQKRQADLRLDVRQVAVDMAAIVPGAATDSALVERIRSDDPDVCMPPPSSNRQLSDEQKRRLEAWIDQGATYQSHWAYVARKRPGLPSVEHKQWVRNPIDRFVLAKLEANGLMPSPEADRATLIKRLSTDLIGLPPTPAEVDAFVNDPDPIAYERLVDRLLASPNYGERLALPWLDAARYADSNGFQQDGDTWQWICELTGSCGHSMQIYRSTSFRFGNWRAICFPTRRPTSKSPAPLIAIICSMAKAAIPEEQRFVILFDRINTTATTWLGLTMAWAQCHDHKYDPITQRDYYSLLDAFNRVPERGTPQFFSKRIRVAAPFIELPTDENETHVEQLKAKIAEVQATATPILEAAYRGWRSGVEADGAVDDAHGLSAALVQLLQTPKAQRSEDDNQSIEDQLRKHFDDQVLPALRDALPALAELEKQQKQLASYRADQIPRVMVMSDDQARKPAFWKEANT